jgi:glyoxylase-like metal-dependent hydrolase (beta-lactamase superfamily II)
VNVTELAPGLWRWTAPHPDWTPNADWPRDVGCIYYEGADAVVLIDPLVPAGEEEHFLEHLDGDLARAGKPLFVLLTVHWHERSVHELVARYEGARLWRREGGGVLPPEVEAIPVAHADETAFWLAGPRAIVPGDVLVGEDGGVRLCPASWLQEGESIDAVRESLRPLLELPVEMVLLSHGEPVVAGGREALAAALA